MNSSQKQAKKRQLLSKHDSYCCWCGHSFLEKDLTLEHIHPKSKGGNNSLENLGLACHPCNNSRGNRLLPPPSFPPKKTVKTSFWLVALIFFYRLGNNRTIFETLTEWNF